MSILIIKHIYPTCRSAYFMRIISHNGIDYHEIKIQAKQFNELKKIGISVIIKQH